MTKIRQQPAHNPCRAVWHNVLGDGSSPLSPTTHSHSNRVFRRFVDLPANWRGARGRAVSGTGQFALAGLFAPVVSGVRKPVPGAGIAIATSRARSTDQTEHRILARPLDWRIAKAGDADAAWQSTFDSSLHKIRCKESERYGHVDLAHAALLALGDAFDVRVCIRTR